ncbi:hypothetical protein J6590_018492 [Homalodisca vitripennis]|nr:hypothetical protein J6590_018492 [Homalodisca vitripennis]
MECKRHFSTHSEITVENGIEAGVAIRGELERIGYRNRSLQQTTTKHRLQQIIGYRNCSLPAVTWTVSWTRRSGLVHEVTGGERLENSGLGDGARRSREAAWHERNCRK